MTENGRRSHDFGALAELDGDRDALFDVLSDRRRRFVIGCLESRAAPVTLTDVADELVAWERGATAADAPADEVASTYATLYHAVVPKLADEGLVTYSSERDEIELADRGDEVAALVDGP